MARIIERPSELPSATRYVMMRDTFLSNWGRAEGKDSIHIYPCDTYDEAEIVKANAEARDDQDRISIQPSDFFTGHMGEFPDDWVVSLCTKADTGRWFEPGAFSTELCSNCGGEGCEECDDSGRVEKKAASCS
jgi:hypothetical protein